jgi:hypothetical protein
MSWTRLESGRVAFYIKAHHGSVDGKAGVELAKVGAVEQSDSRQTRGAVSVWTS